MAKETPPHTADGTPESHEREFQGVYSCSLQPLHGVAVFPVGNLTQEDFNTLFTGKFNLCKNAAARNFAKQGKPLTAFVDPKTIQFMFHGNPPSQKIPVYLNPTLPTHDEILTPEDQERARITKLMSETSTLAQQTAQIHEGSSNRPPFRFVEPVDEREGTFPAREQRRPARAEDEYCGIHDANPAQKPPKSEAAPTPSYPIAEATSSVPPLPEPPKKLKPSFLKRLDAELTPKRLLIAAVIVIAANVVVNSIEKKLKDTAPITHLAPPPPTPEQKETPVTLTSFETVLANSARIYHPETKTWQDNILKADIVTEQLLGGKFRYMGNRQAIYDGKTQNLNHFSIIGEKSGQITAKGSPKEYQTTGPAQAINILLEANKSNEAAIKNWLVWLYQNSFGITLDANNLNFKWKNDQELEDVFYNPPKNFNPKVGIEVQEKMEAGESQPGGNSSKRREPQDILGPNNQLLLPSGISPNHDIVVPGNLLKANPTFTLKLPYGNWPNLPVGIIAEKIAAFQNREKSNPNRITTRKAFGRDITAKLAAPLVDRNDPQIKQLVDALTKHIPPTQHLRRIMALVNFVQSLPYRTEFDTDVNRPGFITLFNGGGDCNNVTILFNELMVAAGYDSAILGIAFQKDHFVLHARGGIPTQYIPNYKGPFWWEGEKETATKYAPIELTGRRNIGIQPWEADETTFIVEEIRANPTPEKNK